MAFDHFTLRSVAAEIERHLQSQTIRSVDSSTTHLTLACGRSGQAYMALGADGYLCHLPEGPKPEGKPLATGERYLRGATVEAVAAEERDRVVRIRLSRLDRSGVPTYGQLICELIRPHFQAYLIREQGAQILAHWWKGSRKGLTPRLAVGSGYHLPPDRDLLDAAGGGGRFRQRLQEVGGGIAVALTKTLHGIDRTTGRELLCRAGCGNQQAVEELSQGAIESLWNEYLRLGELDESGGFTWHDGSRPGFSVIEPTHQREYDRVESISAAVLFALRDSRHGPGAPNNKAGERAELRSMLASARKKLHKRLEALAADLKETGAAAELEKEGNVLLANLHTVPTGASRIVLPDIYDASGAANITIELDPRRSAADNGQWYLKRASKLRRRLHDLPGRVEAAEIVVRQIDDYLRVLDDGGPVDRDNVRDWLSEHRLVRLRSTRGRKEEFSAHPRSYTTSLGWTVLAGRNNKENDQLTHRMASPNDVWFHAHGYAGSHVVLRRDDRREEPGVRNLEEAAGIAAFWSKGKTAKKVPVIYTTVKYVSKPRGGAPGQAVVRREKTLMVEPRLPSS